MANIAGMAALQKDIQELQNELNNLNAKVFKTEAEKQRIDEIMKLLASKNQQLEQIKKNNTKVTSTLTKVENDMKEQSNEPAGFLGKGNHSQADVDASNRANNASDSHYSAYITSVNNNIQISYNQEKFTQDYTAFGDILTYVGVVIVLLSLASLFYKMIINRNDSSKREILMKGTSRIIIGAFIIGSVIGISGIISNSVTNIQANYETTANENTEEIQFDGVEDKGDLFSKMLASPMNSITEFIFPKEENTISKFLGTKDLKSLIVTDSSTLTDDEWSAVGIGYKIVMSAALVIVIIMVFNTGRKFISGSQNENVAAEAREDITRWVYVIIIMASGILFSKSILTLTEWICKIINYGSIDCNLSTDKLLNIKTGSVLITAIIKVYYAYLTFRLNLVYMVRKWMLIVMIVFTPMAAALWGINKNVRAFQIWYGEILSNACIGIAYSIVFLVYSLILKFTPNMPLVPLLIGLQLVLKLGDVLRNSIQGIIGQLSGVDELGEANKFAKSSNNTMRSIGRAAGSVLNAPFKTKKKVQQVKDLKNGIEGYIHKKQDRYKTYEKDATTAAMSAQRQAKISERIAMANPKNGNAIRNNQEKSVQSEFMSNLAQQPFSTSKGKNEEAYQNARLSTINAIQDKVISEGKFSNNEQGRLQAMQFASARFNEAMFGDRSNIENRNNSELNEKKFIRNVKNGNIKNAQRFLSNTQYSNQSVQSGKVPISTEITKLF